MLECSLITTKLHKSEFSSKNIRHVFRQTIIARLRLKLVLIPVILTRGEGDEVAKSL